jgi:hypothetical protein
MIINNKKGVSAVVANVLIILLVVVGVALIWAAVRPAIEEGSEGIQADCITTSVEVQSCSPAVAALGDCTEPSGSTLGCTGTGITSAICSGINTNCVWAETTPASGNNVVVKRNTGGVEGGVTELRLIRTSGGADTTFTMTGISLGALETASTSDTNAVVTPALAVTAGDDYNVAAVIGNNVCSVLSSPTSC